MVGFATQEDIRKNRIMTECDKHRYSLAYMVTPIGLIPVHHAHILAFTGESFRLRQAMERSKHVTLTAPGQMAARAK